MTAAWALGSCVVLGLSSATQGAINLLRDGECTLNFPAASLWANVERIARTTGANPFHPIRPNWGSFMRPTSSL